MRRVQLIAFSTALVFTSACGLKKAAPVPAPSPAARQGHTATYGPRGEELKPGESRTKPGTETQGEISASLIGTWLAVENYYVYASNRYVDAWRVLKITRTNGKWKVLELFTPHPPFADALEAANHAGRPFEPDAAARAALLQNISTLKRIRNQGYASHIVLRAEDHVSADERLRYGPDIAVAIDTYSVGENVALACTTYYPVALGGDTLHGKLAQATLATPSRAGFVPFTLFGEFTMYRLQ
jgi:hypothetical protein